MLICKGYSGFVLFILRLSAFYVQTVPLMEGALSCPQPIHHCNRLVDLMSANSVERHVLMEKKIDSGSRCVCVCVKRDTER